MLGVLAFGDSITNAGGDLQWGVALQSWALWTARGLGMPYSPYAVDGATAADVVHSQIPAFEYCTAGRGEERYDVGCLYVGSNDIVLPGFSEDDFAASLDDGLTFLHTRCERVLTATLPHNYARAYQHVRGRSGAPLLDPHLIERTNRTIERVARRGGTLVLDLRKFGGRTVMMADQVHPTAFGQVAIASAALALLAADGAEVRVDPWDLLRYETSRRGALSADRTFARRSLTHYRRAVQAALRTWF